MKATDATGAAADTPMGSDTATNAGTAPGREPPTRGGHSLTSAAAVLQRSDGDVAGACADGEDSVTNVLRAIHDGRVSPDELSTDQRRRCVSHLNHQGFSAMDMAQLLRVSERTIERDRRVLRMDGAIRPSATLGDELMGELHAIVLASVQRLTRLANAVDAPPYVRVWAENSIVRSYTQMIQTTRRYDYIGNATERLSETVCADAETLRARIARMRRENESISVRCGETHHLERRLKEAEKAAARERSEVAG